MSGFGVRDIAQQGRVLRACAVPPPPYKAGGVTIDWSTVAAVTGSDKTLTDGRIVKVNDKFLRYGQLLCRIAASAIHTETLTATGGTRTLTVSVNGGASQVTTALAYNANAATIQAALEALSNVGVGDITVTGTGPFTYTWGGALANQQVTLTVQTGSLTGGSSTVATTAQGSTISGAYGPYDSTAIDGRQNRTRGYAYLLDETVVMSDPKSDYAPGGVFDGAGAYVFIARVLNNANDLTQNPTRSQFDTLFPGIRWVED
jgi:hypothetical protein